VITTGGTIAARPTPSGEVVVAASAEELLAAVPELERVADVRVVELSSIDSSLMTPEKMLDMAREVRALDGEDSEGFVVTHGTDTMEESAYMVDLLHAGEKPVVFTGAQRNAADRDADGPRNLVDAVRVAASPAARGAGAVIAMAGRIDAARDATKVHTSALAAFSSLEHGKLGEVEGETVRVFRSRPRPQNLSQTDAVEPKVALVKMAAGMDGTFVRAARESGAKAVVLEAFGLGNANHEVLAEVEKTVGSGIPLVVVSRVPSGRVAPVYGDGGGHDLGEAGAIFGGNLSGQKARILLMVALAALKEKLGESLENLLSPHLEI
jgi:L-asparaginase